MPIFAQVGISSHLLFEVSEFSRFFPDFFGFFYPGDPLIFPDFFGFFYPGDPLT